MSEFSKSSRFENRGVLHTTNFKRSHHLSMSTTTPVRQKQPQNRIPAASVPSSPINPFMSQQIVPTTTGKENRSPDLFDHMLNRETRKDEEMIDEPCEGPSLAAIIQKLGEGYPKASTTVDLLEVLHDVDLSRGINCLQLAEELQSRKVNLQQAVIGMGLLITKQQLELKQVKSKQQDEVEKMECVNGKVDVLETELKRIKNELRLLQKGRPSEGCSNFEDHYVFGLFNLTWLSKLGDQLICQCEGKCYSQIDLLRHARRFSRPKSGGTNRAQQFLIYLLKAVVDETVLRNYSLAEQRTKYVTLPDEIQLCVRKVYFAVYGIFLHDDGTISDIDPGRNDASRNYRFLDSCYAMKVETYLNNIRRKPAMFTSNDQVAEANQSSM